MDGDVRRAAVGAFVTPASIPVAVTLLVAMFTVHWRFGFSSVNTIGLTPDGPRFGPPGYEIDLLYIAALLTLSLDGPPYGPVVGRSEAHSGDANGLSGSCKVR